jgi:hypothetical protein
MGWFIVNILAPLFLPVLGIVPLKLLPIGTAASGNLKLIMLVKDGQLCWSAVAMGAASLYDSIRVLNVQKDSGPLVYIGLIIFLMLPSMMLAAGGAAFSTPVWQPAGNLSGKAKLWAWCGHYKAFIGSCVLCAITAYAYTILHFGF